MRYEYKVVTLKRSSWTGSVAKTESLHQEKLNTLGSQGWRMTGAIQIGVNTQVYMMREK